MKQQRPPVLDIRVNIRARMLLIAGLAIALAALFLPSYFIRPQPVFAVPDDPHNNTYFEAAKAKYPAITGTALDSCTLCHTSPPALNPYGTDFKESDNFPDNLSQAFADIESEDSDGDTFDNITEITALTFPGDDQSKPAQQPKIIIEKQTIPNGDPTLFTFSGQINTTLGDNGTAQVDVTPGPYTVSETVPVSWTLTSIICDDANSSGDPNTATATFNVEEGEAVKCVFTNTNDNAPPESTIRIRKQTIPDGHAQSFTFTGDISASLGDDQFAATGVSAGQYTVTEVLPTGWTLSRIACKDDGGNSSGDTNAARAIFKVDPGESVTCIFTNTNPEAVNAELDTTLGMSGTLTTDISNGSDDEGNGVAIQLDGKIVIVGTSDNDFAVVRQTMTGTLDSTFDGDGKTTTDINGGSSDRGNGVAIQPDGKIVVAGRSGQLFALVRYESNGAPDSTFGASGIVSNSFAVLGSSYEAASGNAVALYPATGDNAGKIVVVGSVQNSSEFDDFGLMRFNSNGSLDTSFGVSGTVATSVRVQEEDRAYAVAIQTDGKILVAGESKGQFVLVRYTITGTLDSSFGNGGIVFAPSLKVAAGRAVALHTGAGVHAGKIVVAGSISVRDLNSDNCILSFNKHCEYKDFWVARYSMTGTLDSTFGMTGTVATNFSSAGNDDEARAVGIQSDGKILAAGFTDASIHTFPNKGEDESFNRKNDFAMARYNSDGTLDSSFGTAGKLTTDFIASGLSSAALAQLPTDDEGRALAIGPDGQIVVAGVSDDDFAIAQYDSKPSLIGAFQDPGNCAGCHPRQFQEWQGNMMAYGAISPQFGALEALGNSLTGGALAKNPGAPTGTDLFCQNCHNPIDVALDNIPTYADAGGEILSSFASEVGKQGLSCDFCHQVSEPNLTRALIGDLGDGIGNNATTLTPGSGVKYGPISDPIPSPVHTSTNSDYLQSSEFCGACHDVRPRDNDVLVEGENFQRLENLYTEWKTGPYGPDNNRVGGVVSCQDCHMSAFPASPPGTYIENETAAAFGGAPNRTVSTHYFTGVDIALIDFPGQDNAGLDSHGLTIGQKQRRDELLQAAAAITLSTPSSIAGGQVLPITVDVKNIGAGHNIPSGLSQERQMWVELVVKDANGSILYESGTLQDNAHPETGENAPDGSLHDEDLQNLIVVLNPQTAEATTLEHGPDYNERHSTPPANRGLAYFGNEFLRITDPNTPQQSEEEVFVSFLANHMDNSHSIPPLETESVRYDILIPVGSSGPLSITARLRFRAFPPRFMRLLAQSSPAVVNEEMVDRNLIVEMAAATPTLVTIEGSSSGPYSVGGTVTGLTGIGLMLRNNGGDDLTIGANGVFSFDTELDNGAAYAVTVATQPAGQSCTVASGSGNISGADVTNVAVTCGSSSGGTFSVGGAVSGLVGIGLMLRNNGGDDLTIGANGAFTFDSELPNGATYAVTIGTQPAGQNCTVTNGSGNLTADVSNVVVTCSAVAAGPFSVGGTVTGLTGIGLMLRNNGGDDLAIGANGAFTFDTELDNGAAYAVTVATQPAGQSCTVTRGTGAINGADVTNVLVNCGSSSGGENGTNLPDIRG